MALGNWVCGEGEGEKMKDVGGKVQEKRNKRHERKQDAKRVGGGGGRGGGGGQCRLSGFDLTFPHSMPGMKA